MSNNTVRFDFNQATSDILTNQKKLAMISFICIGFICQIASFIPLCIAMGQGFWHPLISRILPKAKLSGALFFALLLCPIMGFILYGYGGFIALKFQVRKGKESIANYISHFVMYNFAALLAIFQFRGFYLTLYDFAEANEDYDISFAVNKTFVNCIIVFISANSISILMSLCFCYVLWHTQSHGFMDTYHQLLEQNQQRNVNAVPLMASPAGATHHGSSGYYQ